ncbi:MAG: DUF1570 domain-containing protein [Phycisphaerae bacterium]|nr:DUF1570 domain-containing protein [Phycisphaerae bacterium]
MRQTRRCAGGVRFLPVLAGVLCAAVVAAEEQAGDLKKYVVAEYVLYTDLPEKQVKEALARLKAMADMYRRFAPDLPRRKHGKLPVYLYRRFEDYRHSLGSDERLNAGRYDGLVLRAALDDETFSPTDVWRVIRHEGWHQYSHRVVRQSAPPPLWLEEGLAEYFAAAAWKNGTYQPGHVDAGGYDFRDRTIVLQPGRLQRVRTRIRVGQFRPLNKLVTMTLENWNEQTNSVNHDQVWSFVHFLLHAENGKYREALQAYLKSVLENPPKNTEALKVFREHFGDVRELQKQYKTWWLNQTAPNEENSEFRKNKILSRIKKHRQTASRVNTRLVARRCLMRARQVLECRFSFVGKTRYGFYYLNAEKDSEVCSATLPFSLLSDQVFKPSFVSITSAS